jgi:hypothetical protein
MSSVIAEVLQAVETCGAAELHCIVPQQMKQPIRFAPLLIFLDIHREIFAFFGGYTPLGMPRHQLACHVT